VLAGRPPETQAPADWLAAPHCVVVLDESAAAGAPRLALDDHVAALVREARAACWTMRVGSVIAACPVDAEAGGRDALLRRLARFTHARQPLQVAVGGVAEGPEEIRDSFGEAVEALSVGSRLSGAQDRVHDYAALAPLAALAAEPDRARRFVREHLQPLGRLAERPWVLPTLSAYLRCQGRLKEAAADLAVHPNTVRYRLNELRGYLDVHAADGDQAAALLLAVHLSELLAAETAQD
jgi:sugar diacid utilization regulator